MSFSSLLNTICTIQTTTRTQDATTGQWTDSWASHATSVACRLDQAKHGEVRKENDIFTRITHILFLAYRTDLNEHDYRIIVGSNTYNIVLISNAGGKGHHTEISLEIVT